MNINGRSYNFGRCLKIEFFKPVDKEGKDVRFIGLVEHCPEYNPNCYIAMDVTVKDIPSPKAANKPGFQGSVTIYNPDKELLNTILQGTNIFENGNLKSKDVQGYAQSASSGSFKNYYNKRLQVKIYAGYMSVDNEKPVYTQILWGYVNGSSFSHKGTDDVLTFGVFNINFGNKPINQSTEELSEDYYLEAGKLKKFKTTWYATMKHYIQKFAEERIPDKTGIQDLKYFSSGSTKQSVTALSAEGQNQSYITQPTVPVSDKDRETESWFKVLFVKMPKFKDKFFVTEEGVLRADQSVMDESLSAELRNFLMPENGGLAGNNLAELLNGLCGQYVSANGKGLGWDVIMDNVDRNYYIVWRLGESKKICDGPNAEIKIWNYQNLLESPSIGANGQMTVKMLFNPACQCLLRLALMLDKTIKETDVTRNIGGFEVSKANTGDMLGSMASQTSLASFAANQITGNTFLAVLDAKAKSDSNQKGYLFNRGFPIFSVEHKLSTYGKDWTTTVKTIPTLGAGLQEEGKK